MVAQLLWNVTLVEHSRYPKSLRCDTVLSCSPFCTSSFLLYYREEMPRHKPQRRVLQKPTPASLRHENSLTMECESPPAYPFQAIGEREVSKVIFGHLEKTELLSARTVNTSWNRFISENVWPKKWDPVEKYPKKVKESPQ